MITPDFPPAKGGIQILAHRTVASLQGLEPTVVTLGGAQATEFDQRQNFEVERVAPMRGPQSVNILALNATAVATAIRTRPDVVLCEHIVGSPASALLRRRLGTPVVQHVYAMELGTRPSLARFALTRADRVIAISSYTQDLAVAAGAAPDRLVLIRPGVDLPATVGSERERSPRPTLLTIAHLEERYKGHDVILRALPLVRAKVPDVCWRIVGAGPLRPALEDCASALGLEDTVQFLGSVSDEARDQELRSAHVFCMPSRLPAGGFAGEGFGIVYLEAGGHGLPVVAGGVGGATDAVVHNETGLLVDPEDHVAVAEAIVALLNDRDTADRMGALGRQHAEQLTWEASGRRVEAELLQLLG